MTAVKPTPPSASAAEPKALLMGIGGVVTSAADCADFPLCIPFNCTLTNMKVTCKVAPSGAMSVQLRTAAGPVTTAPTYSSVTGFIVTFTASRVVAIVDPGDVDVSEGDFLNFSLSTADARNVLVEVVVVPR